MESHKNRGPGKRAVACERTKAKELIPVKGRSAP
jgi:hypothetical protein